MIRQRLAEAQLALMLLTRLPAGQLRDPAPTLAQATWAYPLVGLPVGLIGWAAHAGLLALGATPVIAAIGTLIALVLTTGALHQDGLADFADGIGGGRDRAHCLEIMRDSRIGSYGVLALCLTLALWGAALSDLPHAPLPLFLTIAIASRAAMVVLLDTLPPARTDGLGQMASGTQKGWLAALALSALLALLAGSAGLLILATTAAATLLTGWAAKRRIGGHTGDVLGTAQTLAETLSWTALALYL